MTEQEQMSMRQDLAERMTAAVGGKVVQKVRVLPGGSTEMHFADGSVLTLHDNGRKTLRQDVELCPACAAVPAAVVPTPISEVIASLHEKLGPAPVQVSQADAYGERAAAARAAAEQKPPPITVSASGAMHTEFGLGEGGAPSKYDWGKLINHPPFQMYVASQQGVVPGDQVAVSRAFVLAQGRHLTEEQAFASYTTWFYAQGRWPRETPTGEPLEG